MSHRHQGEGGVGGVRYAAQLTAIVVGFTVARNELTAGWLSKLSNLQFNRVLINTTRAPGGEASSNPISMIK